MNVPLVDLKAQYAAIKPDIDGAIARVLANTAFAGGPEVEAFEKAFAAYTGRKHCIGVSSGTSAIEIVLRAYGLHAGEEILTVPNTFFATAEGGSIFGVRPVFVDCDEATALIDASKIEQAITPQTKAILPVHLYGQACAMDTIMAIAKKHGLRVIEDCAQAHGAHVGGKMAGSFGDAATYSFYPGKNLGAYGEAGAITTDDDAVAAYCRLFREHGSATKYEHKIIGRNDRMDGLQGAILAAKLPHLPAWNTARRRIAQRYRELLKDEPRVRMFSEVPGAEGVYHLFVVRVANRDAVRTKLNAAGVGAGIHYPLPLHLQECYKDLGHKLGDFPVTERLAHEILSLPIYPEMSDEQIEFVVRTLQESL